MLGIKHVEEENNITVHFFERVNVLEFTPKC